MTDFLLSFASPDTLSWVGSRLLALALLGEVGVLIVPTKKHLLHSLLGLAFAALVVIGYAIENIGDGARFDALSSRATTAEEKLAKLTADRSLSDKQVAAIVERLIPFAGQHFDIVPYWQNPESYAIADRLYKALPKAGWVYDHPSKSRGIILGVVTGISIWSDKRSEPSMKSANELIVALNANGIEARADDTPQANTEPISNKIAITVGTKP